MSETKKCPKCGALYSERSALSRTDGKTEICPKCGTREALETIGLEAEEIEKIIAKLPFFEGKKL